MEECRPAMLHDNMDISRFMVHAQQVEESRIKIKNRKFKRARPYNGGTSKGSTNCFGCGKSGHMVKDCPMAKTQGRESHQAQASGPNSDAPKNNRFYALKSRVDQEDSPDVVTHMLQFLPWWVTPLLLKESVGVVLSIVQ
ncbi:uncharacterized protein LOC107013203 [Solanum pennellii]|uniref:Uncharacterized protein LOC107013203 n=1 Tax=Solanum pennellii TaxID=28526 RepID=A0ABM1GBH1_SOLPN|nr:uncharacterized protein LOC107013203 [Solanum pennellii]